MVVVWCGVGGRGADMWVRALPVSRKTNAPLPCASLSLSLSHPLAPSISPSALLHPRGMYPRDCAPHHDRPRTLLSVYAPFIVTTIVSDYDSERKNFHQAKPFALVLSLTEINLGDH